MSLDSPPTVPTKIAPDERKTLPGPEGAPFVREEVYSDGHVWVGIVTTEPNGTSPWHHHGDHQTYAYVLEGDAVLEYGDDGSKSLSAGADDSVLIIPPRVVHREVNPSSKPNKFLIIRVGDGPPVVPVPDPKRA